MIKDTKRTMASQQGRQQNSAIKQSSSIETPPKKQPTYSPPFDHFALIYLDPEGRVRLICSPSIQEQKLTVFTPNACRNFQVAVSESSGFRGSIDCASLCGVKRRRMDSPINGRYLATGPHSDESSHIDNETVALRIGDTRKMLKYYWRALEHFQQVNCRAVAKAFIKFIEPRKQVRYPYNGGKQHPGASHGSTGHPEKTKPAWWPPGVMHKEPDHLRKDDRIKLLIHIIRKLQAKGITAHKLKEVADDMKRSLKQVSDVELIFEILRVRKIEEDYENDEVDGNTMIYVLNRGPGPKRSRVKLSPNGRIVTKDAAGHIEKDRLTPDPSIEQGTVTLTTPIDTMVIPSQPLPGSFALSEVNTLRSPKNRRLHVTPSKCTDSLPQNVHSTPVRAYENSLHNVPDFEFPFQYPFQASAPAWQCSEISRSNDSWSTSPLGHPICSPLNYTLPQSSQLPPQPSMLHNPMEPLAHPHTTFFSDRSPVGPVYL